MIQALGGRLLDNSGSEIGPGAARYLSLHQ